MLALGLHPLWTLAALCLGAAGVGAVHRAWQRRQGKHAATMWGGWGLLALSVPVWIVAAGPDRGLAFAGLLPSLFAGAFLLSSYLEPDGRTRRTPERAVSTSASARLDSKAVLRTVWVSLLAGPVAALAALCLSGLVYGGLLAAGMAQPDVLLAALLVFTLLWGAWAVVSAADYPLRWRSLAVLSGMLAPAALLALV